MSKQSQANTIYNTGTTMSQDRKTIISEIVSQIGCSPAYASTLYNNARKATAAKPTMHSELNTRTAAKSTKSVTSFTRPVLRSIRSDLEKDLEAFFAERGMSVEMGSMSFTDNKFTTKLSVSTGDGSDAARESFVRNCMMYGLKADDFGKEFVSQTGDRYRITGIKTRGKKYPIMAERVSDGSSFKFGATSVTRALGR